jgi:hypothetical protein
MWVWAENVSVLRSFGVWWVWVWVCWVECAVWVWTVPYLGDAQLMPWVNLHRLHWLHEIVRVHHLTLLGQDHLIMNSFHSLWYSLISTPHYAYSPLYQPQYSHSALQFGQFEAGPSYSGHYPTAYPRYDQSLLSMRMPPVLIPHFLSILLPSPYIDTPVSRRVVNVTLATNS